MIRIKLYLQTLEEIATTVVVIKCFYLQILRPHNGLHLIITEERQQDQVHLKDHQSNSLALPAKIEAQARLEGKQILYNLVIENKIK